MLVIQGDLRLSAQRVEVVYGSDTAEIARLIATGDVLLANTQDAAEANSADYDITTGLLTLTGDVLVTQGGTVISAQSMVVNVTDGTATMQGRVRTMLQQGGTECLHPPTGPSRQAMSACRSSACAKASASAQ